MEWVGPGMLLNTPGRPPPQSPWCPASGPGLWQAPGGEGHCWGARAVTMLMKPGLFSRPAMSKLPTPPVCGDEESAS